MDQLVKDIEIEESKLQRKLSVILINLLYKEQSTIGEKKKKKTGDSLTKDYLTNLTIHPTN